MEYVQLLDTITKGGLLGALLYFIWAASTRRVCFGYQLREAEERLKTQREDYEKRLAKYETERDQWRDLALQGRELVRQAVTVAEKAR
jgi:hypothetical protein